MPEDSFKKRVRKEFDDFENIYADFYDDYKARSEEGKVESIWLHLFGVPFNGYALDEQPNDDARRVLDVRHKHEAVSKAINNLGINELRLGALVIKDSRVSAALEFGLLTPDDMVPPSKDQPWELERLVERRKPDHGDPIFWRTMLEIFCRAFVASQGPAPWTLRQYIELAFDLDEIRRTLDGARWNEKAVRKALRKKYGETQSKEGSASVGENRIRKITKLIGPMDDEALFRLKALFPEAFFQVADDRSHREWLNKHDTAEILNQAEDLGEALIASLPNSGSNSNDDG